ncbi:LacI family DNA-binding transcriptional regulator [Lentzea sp. NPDC042327]|uniref:LacI family DNA-binding transcriptional regulator n=1 Tax=Lentzea sp. NPDC042327 TaxID=3154801 RepID=UPI0033FF6CC3
MFRSLGMANGAARRPGAKLVDVARRADVSSGTVSNVLNHPDRVAEATRLQVEKAIAELGFVRSARDGETAAHWRRNGFATWLFQPAVMGWFRRRRRTMPGRFRCSASRGLECRRAAATRAGGRAA